MATQGYTQQQVVVVPLVSQWSTGLFDCFSDCSLCLMGWCCPCVQSGKNKADADFRQCDLWDCMCCPNELFTRAQLRSYYGLPEPCTQCICCCLPCAICQDARELKARRGPQLGQGSGGLPPAPEAQRMESQGWVMPAPVPGQFSTGLFSCFSDIKGCLTVFCCLPCAIACNKADVDGRACDICDFCCGPSEYFTRKQLKFKWNIQNDTCGHGCLNCAFVTICQPCVACQDRREIAIRRNATYGGVAMGQAPQY